MRARVEKVDVLGWNKSLVVNNYSSVESTLNNKHNSFA